ncbi:BOI-related E3 ubiquitin-protein ligase 1 [Solanum lycopersicum]|uniref:BOI-related E3 ubiquitin-protein ligase 1 n=1 Tax=Solanum lycopersicum TaxID=4081 RepID=UPI0002BCB831|nr:BOI-related E3 ubiquitin-protein ligase 1 [Solanum lycopersicum]XP_010318983.1 BOI-related E3 ubiquitin-protein ligase 1 [Solanum lycopersicum]
MFGEGSSGNGLFPASLEGNRFQYDMTALPQLQLFGDVTVGCSGYPISHNVNDHPSVALRPTKRARDVEPNYSQQKLQISLNNNFGQNEVDQAGSILNPITVSTGLRLSYEEKERNSSVTSAPENTKASLPARLPIDSGFKYEIDRQREEFDHYMKVQEDNMMKGMRELVHRQTASLLNSLQKEVSRKLYEKDVEIDNMNRKNRELGERIRQITVEAQSWHYRAKYNESVVNALKSNIQQAMAHGSMQAKEGCGDSEVNDAASSTNYHLASGSHDQVANTQCCRACKSKEANVLLVPCRHLCLCKACEVFIDSCPVCQVMKTASVQVYMS